MHKEQQAGDGPLSPDDARFLAEFTEEQRKRVIRKVDVRSILLPFVFVCIAVTEIVLLVEGSPHARRPIPPRIS